MFRETFGVIVLSEYHFLVKEQIGFTAVSPLLQLPKPQVHQDANERRW